MEYPLRLLRIWRLLFIDSLDCKRRKRSFWERNRLLKLWDWQQVLALARGGFGVERLPAPCACFGGENWYILPCCVLERYILVIFSVILNRIYILILSFAFGIRELLIRQSYWDGLWVSTFFVLKLTFLFVWLDCSVLRCQYFWDKKYGNMTESSHYDQRWHSLLGSKKNRAIIPSVKI